MNLVNQAIQLFEEGKSQVEIAKIIGKDKSTICKWIKGFKSKQEPQ
jgi:transposase